MGRGSEEYTEKNRTFGMSFIQGFRLTGTGGEVLGLEGLIGTKNLTG